MVILNVECDAAEQVCNPGERFVFAGPDRDAALAAARAAGWSIGEVFAVCPRCRRPAVGVAS